MASAIETQAQTAGQAEDVTREEAVPAQVPPFAAAQVRSWPRDHGGNDVALLLLADWAAQSRSLGALARELARSFRTHCVGRRPGPRATRADLREAGCREVAVTEQLIHEALSMVDASAARVVVPVAVGQAGPAAIGLRQALGARVPGLVLIQWTWRSVQDPPANAAVALLDALEEVRHPTLNPPAVLHVCGEPSDPAHLTTQLDFVAANPWFWVESVPECDVLCAPETLSAVIGQFVSGLARPEPSTAPVCD